MLAAFFSVLSLCFCNAVLRDCEHIHYGIGGGLIVRAIGSVSSGLGSITGQEQCAACYSTVSMSAPDNKWVPANYAEAWVVICDRPASRQ